MSKLAVLFLIVSLTAGSTSAATYGMPTTTCEDATCVESTGAPDATCSTEFVFSPEVENFKLACEATDASLVNFLVADSIETMCEVDSSNSTDTTTLMCSFGLQLANMLGGAKVMCSADSCTAAYGSWTVDCPSVSCGCDPEDCGSPLVGPILGGISAAGMTCDTSGECVVSLTGLPIAGGMVAAKCDAAVCLVPTEMM